MDLASQTAVRVPAQARRDLPREPRRQPVGLRVRHVFAADERPTVLVLVNGEWQRGQLRKWSQDHTGAWWGSVAWGRSPGARILDTLPEDHIWEDGDPRTDRRHGTA